MGAEEAGKRQRRRGLGAVDQRQALLGGEHDRLEAGPFEGLRAREPFAGEEGFGLAHHHRRHMGKGRKIAGGADRAFFRDQRNDAPIQHAFDQPHQLQPHAGGAAPERDQLQRHDQPHDILRQWRADAAAMRQDEIALQGGHIGAVDLDRGEFAEAGIDAVDRRIAGGDLGDTGSGLGDPGIEGGIEPCRHTGPVDSFEILERDGAWVECDGHRPFLSPLKTRA